MEIPVSKIMHPYSSSLPHTLPFSQKASFECSKIECDFFMINHSSKWVKSLMKKKLGCSRHSSGIREIVRILPCQHTLQESWGMAGQSAVSSWFLSLLAGTKGKQAPPICLRREMPNYHASDFPLEGWRQGLNSSSLPQVP
jgi:hypothetical protein